MDWKVQSVVMVTELLVGSVLFRIFIPFFRRLKTGKFDLYIGDRFRQDGSEPKFGGVVMVLTAAVGLTAGVIASGLSSELETNKKTASLVYLVCAAAALLITAVGMLEDYNKETKRGIGLKKRWIVSIEFVICLGFSYMAKIYGTADTKLLLPFHLGNIELGFIFYPLTAVLMTVIINLTQLHDCPSGVTEYGCDGSCALTVMMFSLAGAFCCAPYPWLEVPQMLSLVTAGVCGAFLFWGLSPAKMYLGESGSMLLGIMTAMITVTTNLPITFLCSGIVLVADGVVTLTGHLVFKRTKKPLFKGFTLHGYLKNKGWSDYRIMGVFAIATLVGAAGEFAYFSYGDSIFIR